MCSFCRIATRVGRCIFEVSPIAFGALVTNFAAVLLHERKSELCAGNAIDGTALISVIELVDMDALPGQLLHETVSL